VTRADAVEAIMGLALAAWLGGAIVHCSDEPVQFAPADAAPACGDAGPPGFWCCDIGPTDLHVEPVCRDGAWTCLEGQETC